MTRLFAPAVVFGLTLALGCQAQAEEVTLKKVKYEELTKFINDQQGKVVLVDFWATY